MKTRILSFFFAVLVFCSLAGAQTLSPTVISSSGGFFTSASGMLSFTVAEMTMVQTFTSTNNILTQGFQQPEDLAVGIDESELSLGEVIIYPNPTNGIFTLNFTTTKNEENIIRMYDLLGQVVLSKPVSQVNGVNTVKFDISSFSQGIYMLELSIVNEKGDRKISFHKLNVVY